MGIINQLDPHVADLIAAGEVVERPCSVVKELVENALDAGASAITVEIKAGGLTYMRVTDNGCGMAPEDAETCFLRHATSKLRTSRDLEAIGTLGFRGEALAAISAVSRIELLTGQRNAPAGTRVLVEGGEVTAVEPAGCPQGTTIVVRDLFFNTPARLKFMKSDRAESAAISAMLLNCALSHPGVSLRYLRDGREEYHTPGDGSVQSVVYTLLGRDFARDLVEVRGESEGGLVSGFVSSPAGAKGNRSHQHFFVNGRYIKSKLLQAALEQAYKNSLFTGKFPGCVLYLTIKLGEVDVNVHPTKTEVKFLREKLVFDAVYYSVLSALETDSAMPEITLSRDTRAVLEAPPAPETREPSGARPAPGSGGGLRPAAPPDRGVMGEAVSTAYQSRFELPKNSPERWPAPGGSRDVPPDRPAPETAPAMTGGAASPERREAGPPPRITAEPETPPYRVIGEALNTYILAEQGDTVYFIDKHATHERIIFDRLKAQGYTAMPQLLLEPVTVDLGPRYMAVLLENAPLLEQFGFLLDQFGENTLALRQVPGDIEPDDMETFLSEIAEKLTMGHSPDPQGAMDEVLHTVACKAAIKAGRRSDPAELHGLAGKVLSGEIKYCPHGRPVSLALTKNQLDKQVKRI